MKAALGAVWAAVAVALLCACGPAGEAAGTTADRPAAPRAGAAASSFLLVTLDTTRADHLSPYGAQGVATPTLQALADAGVTFEHAYAVTPVTLPSHASIFTGREPPGHGVRNNGIHYLEPAAVTLGELLQGAGYRTAAFVSAAVLERRYGLDQGFEVYDDDLAAGRPKALRMIAERPAEPTVTAALSWLDRLTPAEPFFLWLHLFDPHAAYAPPPPFAARFAARPYDGEIAYMDAQLGRLLAHPRLRDPAALVMALADHGESLGEHGEASHAMLAYDATLRVPWIVRRPADLPSGARIGAAVSQIDVLPTALDLLGLGAELAPLTLDGVSLAPLLRGAAGAPSPRALYAETLVPFYTYGWAPLRTLRRDGWKLIQAPASELYYLPEDPGERDDRFARDRERAAELQRELARRTAEDAVAAAPALDRETEARLRSLGYLASRGASARRSERPDPKAMIDVHRAIERAEDALYQRDFGAAIAQLRAVLQRDPENLAALTDLAKALAETGELDAALRTAERALALDPASAAAHVSLAILRGRAGEDAAALAALDAALELDPRSLDARTERVRALYRLGREDEAVELLRTLHAEHPDQPRINVGYAELVELPAGELAAAEARLRAAVEREPYLAQGWLVLGRVVERRSAAADPGAAPSSAAADVYRQGLEHLPRDGELHARLGVLLARSGEDAAADEHLAAASAALAEPPAEVASALAGLALRRRSWQDAEEHARRAVARDPASAEGWNQLAIAVEEQGRLDDAAAAYERALAADPEYWQARFNQGLLLRRRERYADAAAAFTAVLAQHRDHASSHFELGLLYAGPLADRARARQHLQACLELETDPGRADYVRQILAQLGG